jgi:hypothetical protein
VAHVKDEAAKVLCIVPEPKRVRNDISLAQILYTLLTN